VSHYSLAAKGYTADCALLSNRGTSTLRRGLVGMITGDETYRRKNKKPARLALASYGLTVTSGIKDGTNGEKTIWVAKIDIGRQGSTQGLGPPEVPTLAEASPRYASCGYACFGRLFIAYLPPSKPKT
jgi:hypothetical protein